MTNHSNEENSYSATRFENSTTKCVTCYKLLDTHAPADQQDCAPKDGDISVCAYCGTVMIFENADNNKLRLATKEEMDQLDEGTKNIIDMIRSNFINENYPE